MKPEQIAQVCHEANRAFCRTLGDNSQLPWDEAPEWQRKSAIEGVLFRMKNPGAAPAQMHQSWLDAKLRDGWRFGPVKDPEKKEHPCMLPYRDLPFEQRQKDFLFSAIYDALIYDGDND